MFDYRLWTSPDPPTEVVDRRHALLCGEAEAAYLYEFFWPELDRKPRVWCATWEEELVIEDRESVALLRDRLRAALADVAHRPPEWTMESGYDGLIYLHERRLVPRYVTVRRSALMAFLEDAQLLVHFAFQTGARVHIEGGR